MILLNEEKDWFENYSKAGKDATRYNKILIDTKKRIGKKPKKLKKVNPCPEIAAFEALEKKQEELINDDNVDIFNEPKENLLSFFTISCISKKFIPSNILFTSISFINWITHFNH